MLAPDGPGCLDTGRLHGLDALRGIMMMLGIVLHGAIAYCTMDTAPFSWHFHDSQQSRAFDVLVVTIHSFRMPLFFVLSGFFMHVVLQRKGTARFIRGRSRRILLPFLAAFLVLTPLVSASFAFADRLPVAGLGAALPALAEGFSWQQFEGLHLMHLWFLYYLMLAYAAALTALRWVPWIVELGREPRFATAILAPVLGLSPFLLFLMESGSIDTPVQLVPVRVPVLLFYVMWLFVGWRIASRPRLLTELEGKWRLLLGTGALCLAAHLVMLDAFHLTTTTAPVPLPARLVNAILAAAATACLCFGILGGFLRLFPEPTRVITFLGDASYWSYLVHLPVVVLAAALLQPFTVSAFVKYPIVVIASSAIVLGSYVAGVRLARATASGAFPPGARSSRPAHMVPAATAAPPAPAGWERR
jgi:glucans biosynthesis protein C